jgi:hypothetical protein
MIDRPEIIAQAAAGMQARGWKRKLAKQRGRETMRDRDHRRASAATDSGGDR